MKLAFVFFARHFALPALLGAALIGCQATSTADDGVTDSHTNWLMSCESDAACGDLSCLCGVCTRSCESEDQCGDLSSEASCSAGPEGDCAGQLVCLSPEMEGRDAVSSLPTSSQPQPAEASCGGAPPSCPAACEATQPAQCESGTWSCPPIAAIPCSDGSPEGSSPVADAGPAPDPTATPTGIQVDPPDAGSSDGGNATADAGGGKVPDADGGTADVCASAQDGVACDVEGQVCGGPCLDTCSFCNMTGCSGGRWQQLEAFPAPCYACGETLTCDPTVSFCQLDTGGGHSCEPLPGPCDADPSCACLESEIPGSSCRGENEGELIVEFRSDSTSVTQCSCTVFTSGSSWCSQEGFGDAEHSVEWVCGTNDTNLLAELANDCIELGTGAPRWCCTESFAPACE